LDGGEEGSVGEGDGGVAGAVREGNPPPTVVDITGGSSSSSSSSSSAGRGSPKHQMTLDAAMLEIEARFLLNLPEEELASVERLFFQLEQAHWYYEDFLADAYPESLPHFELEGFTRALFTRSECLQHLQEGHADLVKAFNSYKYAVPVYGCVCLNPSQDKVLLVCNWGGQSWGLPKGKINEGEAPAECAAREVEEETGYDVRGKLREEDNFTMVQNAKRLHYYIIQGVPEHFAFAPQVRKEVSEIRFWPLDALPSGSQQVTRCLAHVRHWQERENKKEKAGGKKGGGKKQQQQQQQPMQRASSVGKKGKGGGGRAKSAPGGRKGGRAGDGGKEAPADVNNMTTFGAGDAGRDWGVDAMFAANEKLTGRKFTYDGNPQRFGERFGDCVQHQQQEQQEEGGGGKGKKERERAASTSAAMMSSGKVVVARRLEEIEGRHTAASSSSSSPSSPSASASASLAPSVASLLGFSQPTAAAKVAAAAAPLVIHSCGDLERRASSGNGGGAVTAKEGGKEEGVGGGGMDFTFDTQDILSVLGF